MEESHSNVTTVKRHLLHLVICLYINESIVEKSHSNVISVKNHLLGQIIYLDIKESIAEKNYSHMRSIKNILLDLFNYLYINKIIPNWMIKNFQKARKIDLTKLKKILQSHRNFYEVTESFY